MLLFPGCKINIGLNIIGKRSDGFHNLESVFLPVNLTDILEIVVAEDFKFTCTGLTIPGNSTKNSVLNAYKMIQSRYHIKPVSIHLHKQVPMGAGLGGGSADGAATLVILNELFNLKISNAYLESMADELGSDCAFFIRNKPAMITGKGEDVTPIELDLDGFYIKLINPGIHINTGEAFKEMPFSEPGQLKALSKENISTWKDFVFNDFEKTVFPNYPEIRALKDLLYNQGAVYASLTGTGSTVYGIFKEDPLKKMTEHFEWSAKL